MPSPEPRQCPKCEWISPDNCSTYEAQRTELRIHVDLFHMGVGETKPSAQPVSSKLGERFKRPTVGSNISEDDWNLFVNRWNCYKLSIEWLVAALREVTFG